MKREEEGLVIEAIGEIAKVKAGRHNECSSCGACPGDNAMVMNVRNCAGAKPGQRVAFEVRETNMLKSAFIVFVLPLIAIALGTVVGGWLGQQIGLWTIVFKVLGAVIAFTISVWYIKSFDKSVNNNVRVMPTITRIIS
jgi:sigma-E factor negative regulatory protein RseC